MDRDNRRSIILNLTLYLCQPSKYILTVKYKQAVFIFHSSFMIYFTKQKENSINSNLGFHFSKDKGLESMA